MNLALDQRHRAFQADTVSVKLLEARLMFADASKIPTTEPYRPQTSVARNLKSLRQRCHLLHSDLFLGFCAPSHVGDDAREVARKAKTDRPHHSCSCVPSRCDGRQRRRSSVNRRVFQSPYGSEVAKAASQTAESDEGTWLTTGLIEAIARCAVPIRGHLHGSSPGAHSLRIATSNLIAPPARTAQH